MAALANVPAPIQALADHLCYIKRHPTLLEYQMPGLLQGRMCPLQPVQCLARALSILALHTGQDRPRPAPRIVTDHAQGQRRMSEQFNGQGQALLSLWSLLQTLRRNQHFSHHAHALNLSQAMMIGMSLPSIAVNPTWISAPIAATTSLVLVMNETSVAATCQNEARSYCAESATHGCGSPVLSNSRRGNTTLPCSSTWRRYPRTIHLARKATSWRIGNGITSATTRPTKTTTSSKSAPIA